MILSLLALAASNALAADLTPSGCEEMGRAHAKAISSSQLLSSCFDGMLATAPAATQRRSEDGSLLAFVSRNMVFVEHKGKISSKRIVISGAAARLTEVKSIALDPSSREVTVVDAANRILIFDSSQSGNLAPIRLIEAAELEGATGAAVDPGHDELIVSNGRTARIDFYSRKANSWANAPEASTAIRRSIAGTATQLTSPQGVALDAGHGELLVIDRDANQILVFDAAAEGNVPPKRQIRGPGTLLNAPASVTYAKGADEIRVVNADGTALRFPRAGDGNLSPGK